MTLAVKEKKEKAKKAEFAISRADS